MIRKPSGNNHYGLIEIDPWLADFEGDINSRMERYFSERARILGDCENFSSFANGHHYFGFHRTKTGWVYREWAPNAYSVSLIGDFNGWNRESHKMTNNGNGLWEIELEGKDALKHGQKVKIQITANYRDFDRIPLYCRRVVQNSETNAFDGQIWEPDEQFVWSDADFKPAKEAPFIYECHVGMSGDKEGIADFDYFTDNVLPRVKNLGYNTIQLMAVMEHAYYASFGYQITNFFAVSSRFGTPEGLKRLVDTAHKMGIAVLLDIVHSHASSNALDGIGEFDGTDYKFFHQGARGEHPAWGSKVFNYGKTEVVHFLLSNVKFWIEEYHFDGFRFDGVTSMLYHDHALGSAFDSYQKYFTGNTDVEAVTYLQFATELAKEINPNVILIAEDMSAMPGMCLSIADGGIGFDYRLNMGIPDFWVKTLKYFQDEFWDLGKLWYELTIRRPKEKTIGYCESHDQALVGDKTIMFWLADAEMYWKMAKNAQSHIIDRAIALHKMIRLITCVVSGNGYLNFMGNEFGHPEWIDFPREGNGNSFKYAKRQWNLADDDTLRYKGLLNFDKAMISLAKNEKLLEVSPNLLIHDGFRNLIVFEKNGCVFLFNFHPNDWRDVVLNTDMLGNAEFKTILNINWKKFEGYLSDEDAPSYALNGDGLRISLPNRTALVLKKM